MHSTGLLLVAAASLAAAAPPPSPAEAPVSKRQDYSELLQLASSADIAIPTDPAVLLSLAPIVGELASYLPTAPVLSALETAAPSGFLSAIVHDPNYAASFESAFAAGSSPSWFVGLPSTVQEYLHTYGGLGGVATEFASAEIIIASATAAAAAASSASLSAARETGSASTGAASTASSTESIPSGGVSAGATPTTMTSAATNAASTGSAASSSVSSAGAPAQSGMVAAGAVIAAGVLGFAAAL